MSYLNKLSKLDKSQQWRAVQDWIREDALTFFKETRKYNPILVLPEVTMVSHHADCMAVLLNHDCFSVHPYATKRGTYFLTQDDTAEHRREKSMMQTVLDYDDLPLIRQKVRQLAQQIIVQANGKLEAVNDLTREIPVQIVKNWFGFTNFERADLVRWSLLSHLDTFWNQKFQNTFHGTSEQLAQQRQEASIEMAQAVGGLIRQRYRAIEKGTAPNDPVTRLLKLFLSNALNITPDRLGINLAGLIVGSIETTSQASVNVLTQLLSKRMRFRRAREAALSGDDQLFSGYCFEALRFQPTFTYLFRRCEKPFRLGVGSDHETEIEEGTIVVVASPSAMFDKRVFPEPETFNPNRNIRSMLHFGLGVHECLGAAIGSTALTEIVRAAVCIEGLKTGPVEYCGGPVPEKWQWHWNNQPDQLEPPYKLGHCNFSEGSIWFGNAANQ